MAPNGDKRFGDILHQIRDSEPNRVLLSSRSSEWEDATTWLIRDLFGLETQVFRLIPLETDGQRLLFDHLYPDRPFDAFEEDISRFDLHHLLSNTQFLPRIDPDLFLDWSGGRTLTADSEHRARYISALRAADGFEFEPLIKFVAGIAN